MKQFLKPLFEYFTSDLFVFDNCLHNYILISIIGFISYIIAFKSVGKFYDIGLITGKSIGSIIHWSIRFIVFLMLFKVSNVIIKVIMFIVDIPTQLQLIF